MFYRCQVAQLFLMNMEKDARPPEKLSNTGSMDRNWNHWKHDFLIYMKLTRGISKPEEQKAAWLKNLIGQVGMEALEVISFDNPVDKENMKIIMEKLEEHFKHFDSKVDGNSDAILVMNDESIFFTFINKSYKQMRSVSIY